MCLELNRWCTDYDEIVAHALTGEKRLDAVGVWQGAHQVPCDY